MRRRREPLVESRLATLLDERGMTWAELRRRALLPERLVSRLRDPHANPTFAVAERVAAALDVAVEAIWRCRP